MKITHAMAAIHDLAAMAAVRGIPKVTITFDSKNDTIAFRVVVAEELSKITFMPPSSFNVNEKMSFTLHGVDVVIV